jgi:acyl-CoA thioester hydrolase
VSGQTFRHLHRVTYADCTIGNHIYYARYLDIMEAARGELFREVRQPFLALQEQDTIFPVIECRLRYKGAARYDDVLSVELWLAWMERVQLAFAYRILDGSGKLLVEASTNHACATVKSKPRRIPAELAVALRPYLRPPDVGG